MLSFSKASNSWGKVRGEEIRLLSKVINVLGYLLSGLGILVAYFLRDEIKLSNAPFILTMYVLCIGFSLVSGGSWLAAHLENEKLKKEVEKLKQQLGVTL